MQIIKQRQLVEDQTQLITAETGIDQLPAGDIIVPLAYWNDHKEQLRQRDGCVGVTLTGDDSLEEIRDDLEQLPLIALSFPSFRDGRAYSMARRLRLHYRYQGELRAVGNVLQDQLYYMERVGFDSFMVPDGRDLNTALKAFDEFSVQYQASSDQPLPLYQRRAG